MVGDSEVGSKDVGDSEVGSKDVGDSEVGSKDVGDSEVGSKDVGDNDDGSKDANDKYVGFIVVVGNAVVGYAVGNLVGRKVSVGCIVGASVVGVSEAVGVVVVGYAVGNLVGRSVDVGCMVTVGAIVTGALDIVGCQVGAMDGSLTTYTSQLRAAPKPSSESSSLFTVICTVTSDKLKFGIVGAAVGLYVGGFEASTPEINTPPSEPQ
jgi:hypothetical protein